MFKLPGMRGFESPGLRPDGFVSGSERLDLQAWTRVGAMNRWCAFGVHPSGCFPPLPTPLSLTHAEENHGWTRVDTNSEASAPIPLRLALAHCLVNRFTSWESALGNSSDPCSSVSIRGWIDSLRPKGRTPNLLSLLRLVLRTQPRSAPRPPHASGARPGRGCVHLAPPAATSDATRPWQIPMPDAFARCCGWSPRHNRAPHRSRRTLSGACPGRV
jgi:hypothetical protein